MKAPLPTFALAFLIGCPALGFGQSKLTNDPAYLPIDKLIDLQIARPEVNINLPRFLLNEVAGEFNGGPDDPLASTGIKFSELIKDIKLIRVLIIEEDEKSKEHVEKAVKALERELTTKWTPVVSLPEDHVGIYARSDESGETMAGMAVLIHDDEDVVIANLVGRVSIAKIVNIATQVNAIPPEVLKKLSGLSAKEEAKPDKKEKTGEPSKESARESEPAKNKD